MKTAKTAKLAPEVAAYHAELRRVGIGDLATYSVADARHDSAVGQALGARPIQTVVPRTDLVMTLAGRDIRARIHRPEGLDTTPGGAPALVWFHGGGFVLGDLDSTDDICARLALESRTRVISVDYRLAPEHPWPAAHDDAFDATAWLVEHAADVGIDPRRIAVGGDSAGGHLAAATARRFAAEHPTPIRLQVLFYPMISANTDDGSYREFATGHGLDTSAMRWFLHHLGDLTAKAHDEFDLSAVPPPSRLAPAYLITAECDVLRDSAEAYAASLVQGGVPTTAVRFLGMPHGFSQLTGVTHAAEASLAGAGAALRAALGTHLR